MLTEDLVFTRNVVMYRLRRKVISSTKLSCFSHSSKSRFGRYLRTQTFLGLCHAFRSVGQECVNFKNVCVGEERCVKTLITAAKETTSVWEAI